MSFAQKLELRTDGIAVDGTRILKEREGTDRGSLAFFHSCLQGTESTLSLAATYLARCFSLVLIPTLVT